MIGKVTVTKEVAKAIEYRRSIEGGGYNFDKFMQVKTARFNFCEPVEALNAVPIETLASALINGYEVEKSPEENVREYYNVLKLREEYLEKSGVHGGQHRQGWLSVEETLNILGIKIEGVNT